MTGFAWQSRARNQLPHLWQAFKIASGQIREGLLQQFRSVFVICRGYASTSAEAYTDTYAVFHQHLPNRAWNGFLSPTSASITPRLLRLEKNALDLPLPTGDSAPGDCAPE